MRPARKLVVPLAALALAAVPSAARADIFAVTEVQTSAGDLDLARYDLSTRAKVSLPAGVNTPADEFHPSISSDGTRLAFERVDPAAGTTRIVVTELATGRSADLLNFADARSLQPNDPAWGMSQSGLRPDTVVVGRPLEVVDDTDFRPSVAGIRTTGFPSGPFPRFDFPLGGPFGSSTSGGGRSLQLEERNVVLSGVRRPVEAYSTLHNDDVRVRIQNNSDPVFSLALNKPIADPTMSSSTGVVVVIESFVADADTIKGRFLYGSMSTSAHPGCPCSALPAIVNGSSGQVDERPEFTSADDGRYLVFVRREPDMHYRLYAWDTQTTLLLDNAGIDLGTLDARAAPLVHTDGAVAVDQEFVIPRLPLTSIAPSGVISFSLGLPSNIGIIVQKVVGHTRVLGRRAPKLRFVGRVPLGSFRRGRRHVRWNHRVNGRRLAPGQYQVTLRSVTSRGGIRDLGRPVLIRIRRGQ